MSKTCLGIICFVAGIDVGILGMCLSRILGGASQQDEEHLASLAAQENGSPWAE